MKASTIQRIVKNYKSGNETKIGNYRYCISTFPIEWEGFPETYATLLRKHKEDDSMKAWDNLGRLRLYSVLYRGSYTECWQYSELTFLREESAQEYIDERKLAGSSNVYDIFEENVDDLMYFLEEGGKLVK